MFTSLWLSCYTAEDDMQDVYRAVLDLAGKWCHMCCALGFKPAVAETIAACIDPEQCLREVIVRWLRKTYDVDRHGPPTWRTLVKAVSDKAGGNNPALAEEIAKEHKGNVTSQHLAVAIPFCVLPHVEYISSSQGLKALGQVGTGCILRLFGT